MAQESQAIHRSTRKNGSFNLTKPVRCIVKLGGAAITCKNEIEKINEEDLKAVSSQLRQAMNPGKVIGMDWSKRPGVSEICPAVDDLEDQHSLDSSSFIVVHGAGSFGHFQASKSGVHKGGLNQPLVKAGFVATRISVTTLNLEIVRALAKEGIASVGMSPFSCGWSTSKRNSATNDLNKFIQKAIKSALKQSSGHIFAIIKEGDYKLQKMISTDLSMVANAIDSGFVPVLHGDAVLDNSLGCTILSGDVIIRHLAAELNPEYVVFLTDVHGVYDRPPTEPGAVLLREIAVDEDGSWSVVEPSPENMEKVKITVAAHDTTGGMETKILEAAMIAKLGIDVYIVKAATSYSVRAMSGLRDGIPSDWLGTVIRFRR